MKLSQKVLKMVEESARDIFEAKDEEVEVIGKTKSGKEIYINFSHPSHKSFTKEDHEDAVKANRSRISTKNKTSRNEKLRGNERLHSSASKEADKKDDSKDDKLSKAFANIDKQFGRKSEGLPSGKDKIQQAIAYVIHDERFSDADLKNLYLMVSGEKPSDFRPAKKVLDKIQHRVKYVVDGFGLEHVKNVLDNMGISA